MSSDALKAGSTMLTYGTESSEDSIVTTRDHSLPPVAMSTAKSAHLEQIRRPDDTMTSVKAGPTFLVAVAIAAIVAVAAIATPADADLWGHLKFGRDILADHRIVETDPYSFTSDRPWVNHEWLAEAIFAAVYRFGSNGLILFKLAVIAATLALVFWRLRSAGSPIQLTGMLLLLAFAGTFWRTHTIRPQLFSVVLFALLLVLLVEADAGRRRALLAVPPLFALWVNLHGGWIVGAGVLGWWIAGVCLSVRAPMRERAFVVVVGLATVAATLVNPYGFRLWTFLGETVRMERAGIQDWGSVLTSPVALGVPWLLTLASAGFALWRAERPRPVYLILLAVLAVTSFRVSRLDAFFTLTVGLLLAPQFVSAMRIKSPQVAGERPPSQPRAAGYAISAIAAGAILLPATIMARPYIGCLPIGGNWQPPDPAAGAFIERNRLHGRMITWYDWGEYVIWHFGPQLQVSMDGRRETVYSDRMLEAHNHLYAADGSALPFLADLNADYAWFPRGLPIVSKLRDAGWISIFETPASLLFARKTGSYERPLTTSKRVGCFPGL